MEKLLADSTRFLISLSSGNSVPVVANQRGACAAQLSTPPARSSHCAGLLSFRVAPVKETAYAVYPWLRTDAGAQKVGHMNPFESRLHRIQDRRMMMPKRTASPMSPTNTQARLDGFLSGRHRAVAFFDPDLIDFAAPSGGSVTRCKALRELGYKGKILLGYPTRSHSSRSPALMQPRARCYSTRWWIRRTRSGRSCRNGG
jgi:hypothetical protein